MATVNKNFKVKNGLVVEGTTATVNGNQVLSETASDQYIIDLIGGETLVTSVESTQMEVVAGELNIKSGVFDASGAAAAAQAAAATDATTKANNAKSGAEATASADATSKANAAQAAAEATASADATSKANAAISTAAADATTKANNAKSGAEATASSDATSKANAAQSAAISAAATDATTKANAAQSAAEATASADATSKANAAQSAAEATASADATSKANAAQSAAEATAALDATAKADAAELAAIAYTDAEVAALVDSAPALLDTLNELAAAISDNPNYATDLATSVGEKVAKSGDTMTGALTLSGSPTSSLHAATKGYVDGEINTLDTAAAGYASSAQSAAEATASADATSKANAAQAAAEATASSDATSKANAAQSAAEATASADATSKANSVASDLTDHENATEAHGATGAVVGTTNTQTLTNKTIGDTLNFTGAGAMTINSDSHIVLTPAAGSSVKWGADVLATQAYVDGQDTDDIAEGSANLYFTNARAIAAVGGTIGDAINLLDTDDIEEGSTNLYFTNSRALSATAAAYDVAGAAAAADTSARGYADSLATNYDAAGSANTAYSDAVATAATDATTKAQGAYNDAVADAASDATSKASTAQSNATSYTDTAISTEVTNRNSAIATAKSEAISAAEDYTDTAVGNLIGSAPALLDTLQELAAALDNDPDALNSLQGIAAGKQDTLTPGNGIVIDNDDVIYVPTYLGSGISVTPSEVEIDRSVVDTWYDASGLASSAQTAAEATAQAALDDVLDATTAFTALNVNDEAKHIAASSSGTATVAGTSYEWAKADYRSAKLLVKIDNGTDNEMSEILITLDSADNVAITEYAIVGTNGSRGTISADVSGANVRVRVTPTNNSTVKVSGTLLK